MYKTKENALKAAHRTIAQLKQGEWEITLTPQFELSLKFGFLKMRIYPYNRYALLVSLGHGRLKLNGTDPNQLIERGLTFYHKLKNKI